MSDVNLVLDKLKEINESKGENIYLPSLGKKVKFRPFTLKQQKNILSKLPNDASSLLTFNNFFNDIILENSTLPLKLDNLTSLDRTSVILSYRVSAVGSSYVEEGESINLNEVVKKFQSINTKKLQEKEVKNANFGIVLSLPTLGYDTKINNSTVNKLKKAKTSAEVLAEMFNAEILKFIKKVVIFGDENIVLDMYETNYDEKVKIIDTFPNSITKKIMTAVTAFKKIEEDITTVNGVKIDVTNELFT